MWHAVYITATGALVSTGTVIADPLPAGLASVECGEMQPTGEWNPSTLEFDAPMPELPPTWTVYAFLKLLTPEERMATRTLAKTDAVVEDFMDLLQRSGEVQRANPDVASGLDYLTYLEVLDEGRKGEILNG